MVTASKLEQEHLRELESQRRHLSRLLVMEQNRGARLADSSVRELNGSLIKQIQKQIEKRSASQESSLVGSAAFLYDFAFAIERTKSVLALA